MKFCGKCNTTKPKSSFNKCSSKYDGLQATCSDCRKLYRELHKVEAKQYREDYKNEHPEKIKEQNIKHYNKNKENIKAAVRAYAKKNKASVYLRNAKYIAADPIKAKQLSRKKYLSFVMKPLVLERDNSICRLCGEADLSLLHIHHIIPKHLSNSTDLIDNLITLCKTCHKDKAHNGCSRSINESLIPILQRLIT